MKKKLLCAQSHTYNSHASQPQDWMRHCLDSLTVENERKKKRRREREEQTPNMRNKFAQYFYWVFFLRLSDKRNVWENKKDDDCLDEKFLSPSYIHISKQPYKIASKSALILILFRFYCVLFCLVDVLIIQIFISLYVITNDINMFF